MSKPHTPNVPAHDHLPPLASRKVDPAILDWQPTTFPGCYTKTLLTDPSTGLLTALMKLEPGAVLPDHEHSQIEQTYVLDGHLVDQAGPDKGLEIGPGQYVWRPAGSRHTAHSPNGCTILAIFQTPNKFFHTDGKVTDAMGNDWQEKWGSKQS
jgi:quercetin dioxygenase-like cupin family protein